MIKIIFSSFFYKIINNFIKKFELFLKKNLVIFSGPINVPKKIFKISLLRSPHVDKNSRDSYEIRNIKKIFYIFFFNKKILKKILKYNIPSSINVFLQ
ncbi:30S ribosomal protein S10 [Candidatus Vidania fulgoroideorum]